MPAGLTVTRLGTHMPTLECLTVEESLELFVCSLQKAGHNQEGDQEGRQGWREAE